MSDWVVVFQNSLIIWVFLHVRAHARVTPPPPPFPDERSGRPLPALTAHRAQPPHCALLVRPIVRCSAENLSFARRALLPPASRSFSWPGAPGAPGRGRAPRWAPRRTRKIARVRAARGNEGGRRRGGSHAHARAHTRARTHTHAHTHGAGATEGRAVDKLETA